MFRALLLPSSLKDVFSVGVERSSAPISEKVLNMDFPE